MSPLPARTRTTLVTAAAVAAALLVPTSGGASASPATAHDTVDVTGTVVVLAGEDGHPDRYSLLLPDGRTVELADGFTAEPLSHFSGTVEVPGTLARAASSGRRVRVVTSRVAAAAPAPGPTTHSTYVAKVT